LSLDINTKQANWSFIKTQPRIYNCFTYSDGNYAYWHDDYLFDNSNLNSRSCVFRSPPDHLTVDTIIDYHATDGFAPNLTSFGFTKLINGDEVILIKNRGFNPNIAFPNASRLDVIAYNISADSLIWYHHGVESHEGGVLPIRTLGNLAFVPGHMYIHCFDVETGQKLWDYRVDKALFLGDIIVHNNTLLFKGAKDELVCLNPFTGQEIWKVLGTGVDPKARLTLFNNKIFYTADGYLRVASALDGRELYSSKGELWDQQGPLLCTPAIDPINRRIFINNSTFAICLQMPEDW
jgi:outer membrane protein assembly factor BamB